MTGELARGGSKVQSSAKMLESKVTAMTARLKGTKAARAPQELSERELRVNRETLTRRLATEIQQYESRYELRSADLEAAVERGELRETAEVATWVIAYRTLRALTDERQTRAK